MLYLYVDKYHESGEMREAEGRIPEISPLTWKNRNAYGVYVWGEAIENNVLPINHAFNCIREAGKVKAFPENCEGACIVWSMKKDYINCNTRSGSAKCKFCREDCITVIHVWQIWGFFESPEKAKQWAESHAGEWYIFPA